MSVIPGYAGGLFENPTYKDVSSGRTGHAEVVQIAFDPDIISYRTLLEIFFAFHDPTTKNRQGNDLGEQYRSIILYTDVLQKDAALQYIQQIQKSKLFEKTIVTQVAPLQNFYIAEDYHHDYFKKNSNQPYCQLVIHPKLIKLRNEYKTLLRS